MTALGVIVIVVALAWAANAAPKVKTHSVAGYDNALRVAAGLFIAYATLCIMMGWVS